MTNRYGRFAVTTAFGLALATLTGSAHADEPVAAPPPKVPLPLLRRLRRLPLPRRLSRRPAAPRPTSPSARAGSTSTATSSSVCPRTSRASRSSIVPNLYYGVNDQLTVGIAHNPIADIFATSGLGRGLCFSGESDGCAKVYNNLSLDVLFSFMRQAGMDLAGHGGIDFVRSAPICSWPLRLGVKGKMMAGPLMIVFDPFICFGLTKRDARQQGSLDIPVRLAFLATPQLNIDLSTGIWRAVRQLRRSLRDSVGDRRRICAQQPARPARAVHVR